MSSSGSSPNPGTSPSPERHGRFAWLYDGATLGDGLYRPTRRRTVETLNLSEGDTVVDLLCGTGANLPVIADRIGPAGTWIGIDGSEAMLREARARTDHGLRDDHTRFIEADVATAPGIERVVETVRTADAVRSSRVARIVCTLGWSCLPNWRSLFGQVFEASSPGTRFAIMDVYNDPPTPGTRLMDWIAASDTQRPVWEELERRGRDVTVTRHPYRVLHSILQVHLIVASGVKP